MESWSVFISITVLLLSTTEIYSSSDSSAISPEDSTITKIESNANSKNDKNTNGFTSQEGYINVTKKIQNKTLSVNGKATFMCDIIGKPVPKLFWFKGKLQLTDIQMKILIKQTSWGSILKLSDVDFSDEGWYTCTGQNDHGSVNTSFYLTIVKPKRASKKTETENELELYDTADETNGFCQTFQSSTCGQYLSGHSVWVANGLVQSEKERRIASLVSEISSVLSRQADQECLRHLMRLTCHFNFLMCSNKDKKPRKICRSDCNDVSKKRCNYTYKLMLQKLSSSHLRSLPICDNLDDKPGCFRFNEIPSSSNPKEVLLKPVTIPDIECYNGTGADYAGKVTITNKGKTCLHWKRVQGFEELDANFCRNPKLDNIHDSMGPWCFTSIKGDWELCRIRRCPEDAFSNKKSNSHLLPIYIALSGVVGFVFLLLIVCWICRRSYLGLYKPCHGGDFKKPDNHAMQLSKIKINSTDYPLSQIRFQEQIGEGIFGPVYRAELVGGAVLNVIVKTLSAGSSLNLQRDFRREAQMMSELRHVNVLALLGVSVRQIPWCLIFEGVGSGGQDLHELLVSCSTNAAAAAAANVGVLSSSCGDVRSVSTSGPNATADSMDAYGDVSLTYSDQVFIAAQIASGMEYLSSRCFVHRDLAARNVLVSSGTQLQCRICDVGLVRERYSADYYRAPGSSLMLPIRWMPPEVVVAADYGSPQQQPTQAAQFSRESDVWAFGVLLWELWSGGLQPFYGHSNAEVVRLVRARQILPRPEACPGRVYELMLECWNELPRHRPLFRNIHARLRLWQQEAIAPGGFSSGTATAYGCSGGGLPGGGAATMGNGMAGGSAGGSHSGGSHSRHTTSSTEMCSDHSHLLSNNLPQQQAQFCSQPPPPPPPLLPPPSFIPPASSFSSTVTTTIASGSSNNSAPQYDQPAISSCNSSSGQQLLFSPRQHSNNNYMPELSHIV